MDFIYEPLKEEGFFSFYFLFHLASHIYSEIERKKTET